MAGSSTKCGKTHFNYRTVSLMQMVMAIMQLVIVEVPCTVLEVHHTERGTLFMQRLIFHRRASNITHVMALQLHKDDSYMDEPGMGFVIKKKATKCCNFETLERWALKASPFCEQRKLAGNGFFQSFPRRSDSALRYQTG
ncbi:hypothetical protein C5167_035909 [Papaver somniferum]|nr:hypothetical protein C5167_035909 [Papaver somniferum]